MLTVLFDDNWVPKEKDVKNGCSWVRVVQYGNFKDGYDNLLFETNNQQLTNIWFQKEKKSQPLWVDKRYFYCCVVQKKRACTLCGKEMKNDRSIKRHRKIYHFKN